MWLDAIRTHYSGFFPRPGDTTVRQWNTLRRGAWEETGAFYHRQFTPKHFTAEGGKEYGYKPRSGESGGTGSKSFWRSYTGRKLKRFHHTLPLVLIGELREMARFRRVEATVTSNKATTRVYLPRAQKANLRGKHSTIDMRDELTRVSEPEVNELARHLDGQIQIEVDRIHDTETNTIQ